MRGAPKGLPVWADGRQCTPSGTAPEGSDYLRSIRSAGTALGRRVERDDDLRVARKADPAERGRSVDELAQPEPARARPGPLRALQSADAALLRLHLTERLVPEQIRGLGSRRALRSGHFRS